MTTFTDRFLSFFNGMVAGWSQVVVMQPFEIIKVRLQTQSKEAPQYRGIVDCLTKIVKEEGPLALYKGTVTPLIGVGLLGSIRFGVYENFKKELSHLKGKDGVPAVLSAVDKSLAAFATGIISSIGVCTVEHTRIRVQIQRGNIDKVYSGSLDAAVKIFRQWGFRGLNRGQGPTTIRESIGLCLYFTVIEKVTKALTPSNLHSHQVPIYVPLMAGGLGGTIYWVFSYPFDYVKTLMQCDKLGDYKYPTMASCFRDQYQLGGWRTFFKGYLICMMRSFPVNAAAVATYRVMQKATGTISH